MKEMTMSITQDEAEVILGAMSVAYSEGLTGIPNHNAESARWCSAEKALFIRISYHFPWIIERYKSSLPHLCRDTAESK